MGTKIATCSYCSTRAVLVLDRVRHELACSTCGAPLHEIKAMPLPVGQRRKDRPVATVPHRMKRRNREDDNRRPRPGRRRKSVVSKVIEEIWDEIEDIFD